jgi:DNA-directed RNA polymerase alpha subunit
LKLLVLSNACSIFLRVFTQPKGAAMAKEMTLEEARKKIEKFHERCGFLMDELTMRIGFGYGGTYTLAGRGIYFAGDLCELTATQLKEMRGIGRRRFEHIQTYLNERGLSLGQGCPLWREYRTTSAWSYDMYGNKRCRIPFWPNGHGEWR